jgi:hypothetical protein
VPPAARPSTPRRPAVPAPVSHPFLGRLPRAGAMPLLARQPTPPPSTARTRAVRRALHEPAELGRARCAGRGRGPRQRREHGPHPVWPWAVRPRGRGPRLHFVTGPSAVSAQRHPVNFLYFLIYPIHCKFKNLCRIHLNSENYKTNFVGKV